MFFSTETATCHLHVSIFNKKQEKKEKCQDLSPTFSSALEQQPEKIVLCTESNIAELVGSHIA